MGSSSSFERADAAPEKNIASSRSGTAGQAFRADAWLEGDRLARIAMRVSYQHGLLAEDATDVLQELRLAVWRVGPDVLLNATWVFQTARHKAADLANGAIRHSGTFDDYLESEKDSSEELLHLLRARADRLPSKLRSYYALRYREGLSQREIARRLRCSRSSIRWMERLCTRIVTGSLRKAVSVNPRWSAREAEPSSPASSAP